MQLIQKLLCAVALFAVIGCADAGPAEPKSGVEYLVLPTPQNTDSGKKVEVTEFFDYYCPHCNVFDPVLAGWVKKQGEHIAFKRVHVQRDEKVMLQQRLFYTLEALGVLEKFHSKVFSAVHVDHVRFDRDEAVFSWAEKQGIERAKFIDAYRSFGVQAKVRRANAMMDDYHINQWPMIAVDGKYLTSPSQANEGATETLSETQQQQAALRVLDYLVAKAAKK